MKQTDSQIVTLQQKTLKEETNTVKSQIFILSQVLCVYDILEIYQYINITSQSLTENGKD